MIEESLVYIRKETLWLFLLRNKKANDLNKGKWIGVGGKKEENETIEECAIRETYEETGYHIDTLNFKGIVEFHYPNKETEKMYVYTSSLFHGELQECAEGTLAWIEEDQIMDLNLWEGDRIFLKDLIYDTKEPFEITLTYDAEDRLRDVQRKGKPYE